MATLRGITFVQGGFAKVGGIETFAADLLSAFRGRGLEAELICWSGRGKNENPALRHLARLGVRISRTPWRWGCRWGWPDTAMTLQQWRRFAESEVLVFGKLLHDGVHRRLRSIRKRMILITPYRPSEMWGDSPPDREILNSFESIVVQARIFENDLRRLGYDGQVVTLPYLPPEAQEIRAWPPSFQLQIGFLGRLVPDKNLEYLIVSFSRLREMGIEAQLHLFGDGSQRGALQLFINQMKLTGHIQLHGNLDRSLIASAIDQCHIFAFSSKTEGQCLAALEILARGRPVLGTPVGAFPEFLHGPLGAIAPLHNPTAFATALKAVAEPVLNGQITPADVQQAYMNRFQRREVTDDYMRLFSCSESVEREAQAV